jgi:hypothetical protein
MLRTVLLVAAAVCFLLAAFSVNVPRVNLTALGLFLLTVGEFLPK